MASSSEKEVEERGRKGRGSFELLLASPSNGNDVKTKEKRMKDGVAPLKGAPAITNEGRIGSLFPRILRWCQLVHLLHGELRGVSSSGPITSDVVSAAPNIAPWPALLLMLVCGRTTGRSRVDQSSLLLLGPGLVAGAGGGSSLAYIERGRNK